MKIIIVGCGKVGRSIAEQLVCENHDIVVVDTDTNVTTEVGNDLDVFCITGDAAAQQVLVDAGAEDADLLIAMTESDEKNLLICLIGKKLGVGNTIARVRNPVYVGDISLIKEDMGLSMFINPEMTAAREMSRILRCPAATKIDTFAKGRAELFTCAIRPNSILDGLMLKDLTAKLRCRILICGVRRGDEVCIPSGNFTLKSGDIITFVASYQDSTAFFKRIGESTERVKNVIINGGGRLTYYLSSIIIQTGVAVKIIEVDRERCFELDELLPKATIINGDATDTSLLNEEGLADADAVVNLTGIDEQNVLLSQYVSEKYPHIKVITKIKHSDFEDIFMHMKVGSLVNPKILTADTIIRYVRAMQNAVENEILTLHHIMDGAAEALEFRIPSDCPFINKPIETLPFKKNVLLASITRKNKTFAPSGKDVIEAGDNVIAVSMLPGIGSINDLFE